ncbi:MAG: hypothetical protein GX986_03655 [Firmicutes bacterium]|nr:hypothetical protein [Bacillota bacterium]
MNAKHQEAHNLRPIDVDLPPIEAMLGLTWDEVTRTWPGLEERVSLVKTGPPRIPEFYRPGPWRVVAVEEDPNGEGGLWQVVLAREYW